MKCVVGIDLGSTTTKAILLDEQGRLLGRGITNSRSNYEVASTVARDEALTAARFTMLEREIGGLVMLDQLYVADAQGVPFKPIGAEADLDRAIVTGVGDDLGALTEEDFAQIRAAFALMAQYDKLGLGAWDPLSEVQSDRLAGYTLVTERRSVRVFLGEGQLEERLSRLKEVYAELDSRGMQAATIRLDAEKSLERVPVMLKGDDDAVTR